MPNIDLLIVLNKERINNLVRYAEENKLNFGKVNAIKAGVLPSVLEDKRHNLKLDDLDIVYSINWCVGGFNKELSILTKEALEYEDVITLAECFNYDMEKDFEMVEDYQVSGEVHLILLQKYK